MSKPKIPNSKPKGITPVPALGPNSTPEQIQAREMLVQIKSSLMMNTSDDMSAIRIITRLVADRKIQGTYETIGDSLIGRMVDRRFPYTGDGGRNDKLNSLLKSNWYLNRVYDRLNLPLPPHKFTDEKMYRFEKRRASLFEWLLGLIFILQKGNVPRFTKSTTDWINKKLLYYFAEVINDEKEFQLTWQQFQEFQAQKKAKDRELKEKE